MNGRYTIAMARTSDPHSAIAPYFINVNDDAFLGHTAPGAQGWGYCVFGRLIEEMEVADRIKGVRSGNRGSGRDEPVADALSRQAELV